MTTQPEALRLADSLSVYLPKPQDMIDAAAELRRLHQQELANIEWQEKTAWVQKTAKPDELGMHRADVMSRRLGRLKNQRDALLEALKQIEPILARMYGPQAAELPPMQIVRAAIAKAEGEKT